MFHFWWFTVHAVCTLKSTVQSTVFSIKWCILENCYWQWLTSACRVSSRVMCWPVDILFSLKSFRNEWTWVDSCFSTSAAWTETDRHRTQNICLKWVCSLGLLHRFCIALLQHCQTHSRQRKDQNQAVETDIFLLFHTLSFFVKARRLHYPECNLTTDSSVRFRCIVLGLAAVA